LKRSATSRGVDVATAFLAALRPDGPICRRCGGGEYSLSTRRVSKCNAWKKQYSAELDTIFVDSTLGLETWNPGRLADRRLQGRESRPNSPALWTHSEVGLVILNRIRLVMQMGSIDKLDGEVEVDETFIGGKTRTRTGTFALARSPAPAGRTSHGHGHSSVLRRGRWPMPDLRRAGWQRLETSASCPRIRKTRFAERVV
jgi:hypothetical protein